MMDSFGLKPELNEDEKAHQRGQDAEQFMKFIQDGEKYFLKLLTECETEIANSLLNLSPESTMGFTILQAQRQALYEPLKRVYIDIELGKKAYARLTGTEDKTTGIL